MFSAAVPRLTLRMMSCADFVQMNGLGFTAGYDTKSKRRLFEVLRSQGMAMNQHIIFLSEGGDTVGDVPLYMSPNAEHMLDWFHISMRLTVVGQQSKSVRASCETIAADTLAAVERVRHFLWYGNVARALEVIEEIEWQLDAEDHPSIAMKRPARSVGDCIGYLGSLLQWHLEPRPFH